MGVNNLLKFIKPLLHQSHIQDFAGKRLGIDAMNWLYIGAIYAQQPGTYLNYSRRMIQGLLQLKIIPIFVFDGKFLLNKQETRQERSENRQKALKSAIMLNNLGQTEKAKSYARRAIVVTKEMINSFINDLKSQNLELLVAPGEADPQLAHLCKQGYIDIAVSQDSDLLCFGCPRILYKLKSNGLCRLFDIDRLANSYIGKKIKKFDSDNWGILAALSGCDYLKNLRGLGVKKAFDLIITFKSLGRIFHHLKFSKKFSRFITEEFKEKTEKTVNQFKFYPVYDPVKHDILPLNPTDTPFLKINIPPQLLSEYIQGSLDPDTLQNKPETHIEPSFIPPPPTYTAPTPITQKAIQQLSQSLKRPLPDLPAKKKPQLMQARIQKRVNPLNKLAVLKAGISGRFYESLETNQKDSTKFIY